MERPEGDGSVFEEGGRAGFMNSARHILIVVLNDSQELAYG